MVTNQPSDIWISFKQIKIQQVKKSEGFEWGVKSAIEIPLLKLRVNYKEIYFEIVHGLPM